MTTPSAPLWWLRNILLMTQPPLLTRRGISIDLRLFVLLVMVCASLSAQVVPAPISFSGSVYDANGTPIQNATVIFTRSNDFAQKVAAATDGNGEFRIPRLGPGHYFVDVACSGYAGLHLDDVDVQAIRHTTLNVMLPRISSALGLSQANIGAPAVAEHYRIGNIRIIGYKVFNELLIRAVLGVDSGEVFDESLLRKGLNDLKKFYGSRGYINFTAVPVLDFDQAGRLVELKIEGDEDRQFTVNRLSLTNTTTATDQVIRSQLPIKEGELFNAGLWDLGLTRLQQLGYFDPTRDFVSIKASADEPTVDIELNVSGSIRE